MAIQHPALAELAHHFGIQTEFWDWKGRHTEVDDQTVVLILRALEIDAATDEAAWRAVEDVRLRPWRRALPPCTVLEQGQSRVINVHVDGGSPAHVYIRTEDGRFHDAHQVTNDEPDREVDGRWTGEASFEIPAHLPLGYHRIHLESNDLRASAALIVTPTFVGIPRAMGDKRVWGLATQLYSVRSKASWGVGDLVDLADLSVWSATQTWADYVLINPLHAAQPMPPIEPSPYLPASRKYVNPLYLRPEAVPEYAGLDDRSRDRIEALRTELQASSAGQEQIDRNAAWVAKTKALEVIFEVGLSDARKMAFEGFRRREGRSLRDFATWCALFEVHGPNWREWPEELRRPTSPEVAAFHRENARRVEFFEWLQWNAEHQVSQAQQAARDAGMSLGIISDLAVGVNGIGADTWMLSDVFAQGASVGAPPDQFNQHGQDWGQPPWRPDRLEELAYAPFREMVSNVLRHSGGVRIDHIIGLFRLWWVPPGATPDKGAYVRYNHEALIGILALEAYRSGSLVIGEDLGTVEPWVRDYLARRGILGTSVMWFETHPDGWPLAPEQWREYCLASVTTHDLPPTTGYLAGDHVRLRDRLGLLTESLEEELEHARREHQSWVDELHRRGLVQQSEGVDEVEALVLAMHRFLLQTPAKVLNVALTDAVGDRKTQNQPGTIDEYPNWRVPLSGPDGEPMLLEDVYASERAMRVAAVMNGYGIVPAPWGKRGTNAD